MPSVQDVAAAILERTGPVTAMKLEKLVYYAQAWAVTRDGAPLFKERIEAWRNGPVCPALYFHHRGALTVATWPQGNAGALSPAHLGLVEDVLAVYGGKSSEWLSDLTHREAPWIDARAGLMPQDKGNVEITPSAMKKYYESSETSERAALLNKVENPFTDYLASMSAADEAIFDELAARDREHGDKPTPGL